MLYNLYLKLKNKLVKHLRWFFNFINDIINNPLVALVYSLVRFERIIENRFPEGINLYRKFREKVLFCFVFELFLF